MAKTALGRRRGTRSSRSSSQRNMIVGLVVALVSTALLLGIVLGANLLLSPSQDAQITNKEALVSVGNVAEKHLRGELNHPALQLDLVEASEKEGADGGSKLDDDEDDVYGEEEDPDDDEEGTEEKKEAYGGVGGGGGAVRVAAEAQRKEEEELEQMQHEEHHDPPKQIPILVEDSAPTKPFPHLGQLVPETQTFNTWTAPGGGRFKEYTTGGTPYLIDEDMKKKSDELARSRRIHVKNAMKFAWDGYSTYAFGMDEILPRSKRGTNGWGGMGTTLVDSLDTLWLMDMKEEFYKARDWVRDELTHEHSSSHVSVFETTIRSLGGLLSAYDWSGDKAFLDKAEDLGKRLFKAFDSPSGIPYGQVNLVTGKANNIGWAGGNAILAEFGSIQIEFRYLAKVTNMPIYAQKSEHVFELLNDVSPKNGLFPYYARNNKDHLEFANNKLTFGAMADSLYEYMLKIWLQGGKTEPLYREMYDKAIQGMHDELLQTSTPSGLTYIADKNGGYMDHKMDHLVCFMGGLLALGAYTDPLGLESPRAQRDLKTGKALTYTCYQMYARMNTGISAEWVAFEQGQDFEIGHGSPHYLLRPEAVESMFILNQLTGDPIYREWGWEVFQAIERYCKTEVAYGGLRNVQNTDGIPDDKMESFFLAETLKYLYLLQDPDTEVDILNKHVFNTEAHPMRIFPEIDKATK